MIYISDKLHSFDHSAGFDMQRIAQRISEHLEAAADTENYFSGRSRLQYGRFQTIPVIWILPMLTLIPERPVTNMTEVSARFLELP